MKTICLLILMLNASEVQTNKQEHVLLQSNARVNNISRKKYYISCLTTGIIIGIGLGVIYSKKSNTWCKTLHESEYMQPVTNRYAQAYNKAHDFFFSHSKDGRAFLNSIGSAMNNQFKWRLADGLCIHPYDITGISSENRKKLQQDFYNVLCNAIFNYTIFLAHREILHFMSNNTYIRANQIVIDFRKIDLAQLYKLTWHDLENTKQSSQKYQHHQDFTLNRRNTNYILLLFFTLASYRIFIDFGFAIHAIHDIISAAVDKQVFDNLRYFDIMILANSKQFIPSNEEKNSNLDQFQFPAAELKKCMENINDISPHLPFTFTLQVE